MMRCFRTINRMRPIRIYDVRGMTGLQPVKKSTEIR